MTADFPVLLDVCVLVQACLRDTLLRLFQKRLFLARWSDNIIEEVCRTLQMKLQKSPAQTDHLVVMCPAPLCGGVTETAHFPTATLHRWAHNVRPFAR